MCEILLADDHEIVRHGLRRLLETQPGWKICGEAGSGREAVEKTRQLKPDIVILDHSMPELSGAEAARRNPKGPAANRDRDSDHARFGTVACAKSWRPACMAMS